MRRLLVAVGVVLGALAVLAAAAPTPDVEESVTTFEPTTPAREPAPAPTPDPTPTPTPDRAASAAADDDRTRGVGGEGFEIANTEPEDAEPPDGVDEATAPVVDEYFIPNYVGAVDRSAYDADVSAPLVDEPLEPTPAPPTPTPHTHPDPTPEGPTEPAAEREPSAEPAPEPDPTVEPTPAPTDPPEQEQPDEETSGDPESEPASTMPTEAQWEALRQCESGGNYTIVSPGGTYRGAYQFSQGTWDWVAAGRWPALVGVDPADASPADQDKMARRLYRLRGAAPWPTCGRHLR